VAPCTLFSGIGSIFARDRGGSLKRLHRPYRFRFGCTSFDGGLGINVITGVDPVYFQRGPYEAPKGTNPSRGQ
jgi:hypothetical protein